MTPNEKTLTKEWNKPIDGIIHVPDELDPLINKVAFQIRFHTISGKGEAETVADIVYICQKFFASLPSNDKQPERMFTLEEAVDIWNAGYDRAWEITCPKKKGDPAKSEKDYFKQKFNIDL